VLVFLRRYEDETILCVSNLSRFAQYVELDLNRFEGCTPVELWSNSPFPPIGELPYLLTLGPHNFLWFQMVRRDDLEPDGKLRADWRDRRRRVRGDGG
jgi:maltose alpha-D-glucosyltransferase/alpha-amylase